jgi:hypothetical protein
MKRVVVLALAALLGPSCQLAEREGNPELGARNTCAVEGAPCGVDGLCSLGRCLTAKYVPPEDLVFEVTPSAVIDAKTELAPGVPYYLHSGGVDCTGTSAPPAGVVCLPSLTNQSTSFDRAGADGLLHPLKLPPRKRAQITSLVLTKYTGCALPLPNVAAPTEDGAVRVRASYTLVPTDTLRGLPAPTTLATRLDANGAATVDAQVGSYWLYVRLRAPATGGLPACLAPPLLVTGYTNGDASYPITIPVDEHVSGTIKGAGDVDMEGWDVTIVDPVTGFPLSLGGTVVTDAMGVRRIGAVDPATGALGPIPFHSPISAVSKQAGPWTLVLSPPPGAVALPSFAWSSDVLSVLSSPQSDLVVELDLSAYTPGAVTISSARLEDAAAAKGLPGRVFVRSQLKGLAGAPPGRPTSFSAVVDTDAADPGRFDLALPPGRYDVIGVPFLDSGLGMVRQSWLVGSSPPVQGGRILSATGVPHIAVTLSVPAGAAPNVAVSALPAPSVPSAFDVTFGTPPLLSRGGSSVTDAAGAARVPVDAGLFDVVARFPVRSGFAWSVRPGVVVSGDGASVDLPAALPAVVYGHLGRPDPDQDTHVTGGVLRAYALVGGTATDPARYIQVGEAEIGETGAYELLLPSRLGP